jgi:hypothetical protein
MIFPDGAAAARQVLALKTEVRILVREFSPHPTFEG